MIGEIENIAREVDAAWKREDYSCYAFPGLAAAALADSSLPGAFSLASLGDVASHPSCQVLQIPTEFSDLHLKAFDNGRFYVEVLTWWDRDTAIHDHNFCGALLQLDGSAVNAMYVLEDAEQPPSQLLQLGSLALDRYELSCRGQVRAIPCGRSEKHAVIHVSRPCISLILRTHPIPALSPQLNYFPPHVVADYAGVRLVLNKQAKWLKLLAGVDQGRFRAAFAATLAAAALPDCFWLIIKLSQVVFTPAHIDIVRAWAAADPAARARARRAQVLASAARQWASQFVLDRIKVRTSCRSQRLALTVLATAGSACDHARLAQQLEVAGSSPDLLMQVEASLPPELARGFRLARTFLHGSGRAAPPGRAGAAAPAPDRACA